MKTFKKVISLVLVFAMLASFAGMTGYKYSPMSIEAQASAASPKMVTYTFEGGYSVTVADVWYKTTNSGMTYGGTAIPNTYYGISSSTSGNDLSVTFNYPTDGAWRFYQFLTDKRPSDGSNTTKPDFNGNGNAWGTGVMDGLSGANIESWLAAGTTTRGSSTFMDQELGNLYKSTYYNLNTDEKQGFRDIDTVYLVFAYKVGDVIKYAYIDVDVIFYDKKDNANAVQWTDPATSSTPKDSAAGKNQMKYLKFPTVLYKDSYNNIVESLDGVNLDRNISLAIPHDSTHLVIKWSVDYGSSWYTTWDFGRDTIAGFIQDTNGDGVTGNDGDYIEYTGEFGISSSVNVPSANLIEYELLYTVPVTFSDGTTREVTYTQFGASYVTAVPRYKAGYAIQVNHESTRTASARKLDIYTTFFQTVNFNNFLANNFNVSLINKGDLNTTNTDHSSDPGVNGWYTGGTIPTTWNLSGWSDYDAANSGIRYFRMRGEEDMYGTSQYGFFIPGKGFDGSYDEGNYSNVAVGAQLYYDKGAVTSSSITAQLYSHLIANANEGSDSNDYSASPANITYGWGSVFKTYTDTSAISWAINDTITTTKNAKVNLSGASLTGSWIPSSLVTSEKSATTTDQAKTDTITFTNAGYSGTATNYLLLLRGETYEYRSGNTTNSSSHGYSEVYFSYAFEFVPVDRTIAHSVVNLALTNNYVEEEMDPTWWKSYKDAMFHEYRALGNLQATGDDAGLSSHVSLLNNPTYLFADYTDLNTQLLTVAEWDRGGKSTDGINPDTGYHTWGASYAEWNENTYNYSGAVDGALAVYDLKFDTTTKTLSISDEIRTGAYYYTADSWNNYVAARNKAVAVYNYATSGTFSYDTAYPAKTPSDGDMTVGLACYHKAKVDSAATALSAARAALVKKDSGNYDISSYYGILLDAANTLTYDGDALLQLSTGKHGLANIYNAEKNATYYDSASLQFRANHADDVYSYIWRASENSSETGYAGDGVVVTDADGNPLYCIDDKGTTTKADDETVLASATNPATGEPYDVGILEFPITGKPVGQGNTFSQLMFDNTVDSGYAVDNARLALQNRLRWEKGGGSTNTAYKFLQMEKGAYTANIDGTGDNTTVLNENLLITNAADYMWTGVEHQDDILRAAYAMYAVAKTLRLATNYKEVYDVLNATNGKMPAYDAMGSTYTTKQLHNVKLFQSYTPTSSWDQAADAFTVNNVTYNTTGKTWYTEDTWAGFIADREKLAALLYNSNNEIGKEFDYTTSLSNGYYTYDVELSSGQIIKNTYFTNSYYYGNKDNPAINENIDNRAAYGQAYVNQLVDNYLEWFDNNGVDDGQELVLKNLDVYEWEAYDETTVASIEEKVASLYKEIDTTQAFVDFVPTTENGTIKGATLSDTEIKLYAQADIDELNALADYVTALHESTTAEAVYKGTDSLADNADAFDKALDAFNTKYLAIKNGGYQVDKSSWGDIFTHLTTLAGGTSITQNTILGKLTTLYNDTNADENGQGDVYNAIDAAIEAYEAATTQAEVNAAVTALYNALATPLTSKEVGTAADAAIAYPKNLTFNVYNYTMDKQDGSHETPSRFTADSVAELEDAATAAKTYEYNMLGTYTSSLTAKATEVTALKNLKSDNNGGVLVYTGAVTTYLETAIAYAESELYSDVANQVVKTTRVTNPAGTDYVDVPLYSEQSVAELKATLTEAKAALAKAESGEYGWADQIELDKYTFLVYDETAPDTGDNKAAYLLVTNIISNYTAPYTWSTVADGVVTKTDNWGDSANTIYEKGLYGETSRLPVMTGMVDAGLQSGPAYYGFLEDEYKATTVVKTNDDGTTTTTDYKDIVWKGDGTLVYTANNVAVGATTFNNWSSYMEYYDKYATIDKNLTIDSQSTIDTLASDIYRTRNALTLNYFPSNQEGFAEATKLFNQLKAYETATTPITRYGYAADADGNVIYENGELVKGEPTDSAKQLVALYSDIPAEFIAEVAEFEAKYANMNSTEPYNSWEEGKVQDLYNRIYNTYLNPETAGDNLITAKAADHDDFKAGFNDLVDNYIAGTWNEETLEYASNLLNETQVNGLDTALTGAQNVFKTTTNVDATYGTTLAAQTDIVFNYTMTPATYLQFATYMREKELYYFLETKINVAVEFYYGANGKDMPVFNQAYIEENIKTPVNTFFADENNWPLIYQVNGVTWEKGTTDLETLNWDQGYATTVTGYDRAAGATTYTNTNGATDKITAILDKVGSKSDYYRIAMSALNSYDVAPYMWLLNNAFVKTNGDTAVLGKYTLPEGTTYPVAYKAGANWYNGDEYAYYTADSNGYYLYDSAENDSWFKNTDNVESYLKDDTNIADDPDYVEYFIGDVKGLDSKSLGNGYEYWSSQTDEVLYGSYTDVLLNEGWTLQNWYDFVGWAGSDQYYADKAANELYNAIYKLQLRPATEAYREVVNAYFGLQGLKYTWPANSTLFVPSAATEAELGYEVFYNMSKDTFINKISPEKTYVDATETSPEYGMVAGASLWERYKLATYEAGSTNYYDALTTFYTDLIGTTNLVTIDKAAEVYSYNAKDDLDDSLYEKFVAIAQNLKLDDFNREWLDAIVDAFLTGNLDNLQTEDITTLFDKLGEGTPEFKSSATETGLYYNASFYTQDSLEAFANVLVQNQIVKNVFVDGELISLTVQNTEAALKEYKGTYYDTAQQIPADDLIKTKLIPSLNTLLVLRAAETAAITTVLDGDDGAEAAMSNESLYVKTYTFTDETTGETINAWDNFVAAYKNAKAVMANCNETVTGYYTEAEDSAIITEAANALATALSKLKKRADKSAPQVEVSVDTATVQGFYTNHAADMAKVDTVTSPVSGTLFMPNNGGYSLLVYTNEVNPRIYLNIEDAAEKLTDNTEIAASKKETISVSSKRTSGTVTNLIYGTLRGTGEINDVVKRNLKADTANSDATGPLSAYTNTTIDATDSTKNEDNSSVFAILAPTFNTNSATAAAIYSITIKDQVPVDSGTLVEGDNYSASLVLGDGDPVGVTTTTEKAITVYIYFHNSMADGTDEGIVYGEDGMATLAKPKYGASHVASVLLSGEPSYTGAWRRGLGLTRSFDSSIRSWEFMSEIIDNAIGGVENVAYSDPTFGSLNTGSFYYVLDESDPTDKAIIDTYYGEGNDAAAGLMDYDKATVAKTDMIAKINAMDETAIETFKTSEGFHEYGATYSRGENKGEYINYAQVLTNKVEKGDLVFVHIVDRWGNVVNRIVEITNLDKVVPVTATTTSGEVTITEEGGSGLKDITVHNGDFSLGSFEYEVSTTQKKLENQQVTNSATVECADNKLTITQLVPGKLYYIGAYDNAGNASSTPVNANADGQITLSITNETTVVETGEDMSLNGSSTFTLNGTDTIILNAGEASSVIDASIEGNVFANRSIRHYITTKDTVTGLKTVYQDGTVEEFTAEDVTVTDNGDGTLKWLIMRKLTEGEHTYNIYAMVDGEYESFYAPATITATSRTVTLTYTISGLGRTVLKYSGSNEIKNSTMDSREIPYGAKVTITAQQSSSSSEFYYWMNSYNERIINTANAYEFTAVTNTNIMAQFTSYESLYEGKKLVIYVNNAKNVIKAFELADGDTYTVPTGPVLPDYTFKGWSMTRAEVLASDKDTIIVEPIYELNASNTVTITEGNYTATGAGTYTAEDNQRAVVTISTSAKDDDGNEFLYWIDADTSEIVSYERTYSFFCVKDTELTPVYGDASTVTAEPIVRITEVKFNALSGKVSFFAERSVPEEFTILQTGIVVTKTESIGTNEEVFVVGGTSTAAGTSTSTANNGYYSASAAVATGQTVWARAYAIYETADGEIFEAYGPVVSYTVD